LGEGMGAPVTEEDPSTRRPRADAITRKPNAVN
jgi:hypothetical protein